MFRSQSCIYFFRSLDGLCPDILLQRDIPLILGNRAYFHKIKTCPKKLTTF